MDLRIYSAQIKEINEHMGTPRGGASAKWVRGQNEKNWNVWLFYTNT